MDVSDRYDFQENTVAAHYGRRQGLLRHSVAMAFFRLGGLRRFQTVAWTRVERFVFVCQGNICRSPYAEARAKAWGLSARSFGLKAATSSAANPVAIRIAQSRGLRLTEHLTAPASCFTVRSGDLLVAMERAHIRPLVQMVHRTGAQVTLLGLWSDEPRPHIEDPYGLSEAYFHTCFDVIDSALSRMAECWRARHGV